MTTYIIEQRKVVIERGEDNWWVATVASLPGCISQGKTRKEAKQNIEEAIKVFIDALVEDGIKVPPVGAESWTYN